MLRGSLRLSMSLFDPRNEACVWLQEVVPNVTPEDVATLALAHFN